MSSTLANVLFWIAVAACTVAQFFIVRATFRPTLAATEGGVPMPRRAGEVVWAVLPALLLAAAFVFAWRRLHLVTPS